MPCKCSNSVALKGYLPVLGLAVPRFDGDGNHGLFIHMEINEGLDGDIGEDVPVKNEERLGNCALK